MGLIYAHHEAFFWRTYSSVNIQNGALIIDAGDGTPLRENGRLAVRSLARPENGSQRFTRLLTANGHPLRLQQSAKLVNKDEDLHKAKDSLNVLILAKEKVKQIERWEKEAGSGEDQKPNGNVPVADFFDTVFMPWVTAEKEASTARSYKNYWNAYLRDHFNHSQTLRNYEPYMGTNLLQKLARDYSENTLSHVRALASNIFRLACAKSYITSNPWREVVKLAAGQDVDEGYAYNEQEVERILDALEHVSGREEYSANMAGMAITIGFYAGLRPSETAGLKWEHVTEDRIRVQHAYVQGAFKGTKTGKNRTVVMLPQLQHRMRLWAMRQQYPSSGWVFPNQQGTPINMNDLSSRVIAKTLKKLGM